MKPQKDYSFIRGVCHNPGNGPEEYRKEIGYAVRMGINSFRAWLPERKWKEDPAEFFAYTDMLLDLAWESGISVMPILFNGNMLDPAILEPEWMETKGDEYVRAVVARYRSHPGLIMWDVMNEPSCNDWLRKCTPEERPARWEKMHRFLKHYCALVKELDPEGTITIGHTYSCDLEPSAEWVDVISVHDYLESEERIRATYEEARRVAEKYGKPLINSEISCVCRANPYELSMRIAREYHAGFYVFCLMIRGYWSDVHGLVYPDGTVRDPSVIAAMLGFYRNCSPTRVKFNPNKEGKAEEALSRLREAMTDSPELFRFERASSDRILEALEWVINLLEASEMVPMYDPPRAKLLSFRAQPEEERDPDAIRAFAYEMAELLKRSCYLF